MVAKKFTAPSAALCRELDDLWRRLEGYRVCVSVAANALRHQNADMDADVALALIRGAANPLHDEIERVAKWAKQLKPKRPKKHAEKKKKSRR